MKKMIYCSECKWLYRNAFCHYPKNLIDSPLDKEKVAKYKIEYINGKNNCRWYEAK